MCPVLFLVFIQFPKLHKFQRWFTLCLQKKSCLNITNYAQALYNFDMFLGVKYSIVVQTLVKFVICNWLFSKYFHSANKNVLLPKHSFVWLDPSTPHPIQHYMGKIQDSFFSDLIQIILFLFRFFLNMIFCHPNS